MDRTTKPHIADMGGVAALPRQSGELVFQDPWERRVFALAVALCEQGLYTWNEFRDRLMAAIAAAEQATGPDTRAAALPSYYEHWLAAFEQLLREKGLCTPEQGTARKTDRQ
jgi:nitrile hydratase accessory protein